MAASEVIDVLVLAVIHPDGTKVKGDAVIRRLNELLHEDRPQGGDFQIVSARRAKKKELEMLVR